MKLILHIGMSKTGSTALQFTLSRLRSKLKKNGILYPCVNTHSKTHQFLAAFVRQDDLPRSIKRNYVDNTHKLKQDIEKSFSQITQQIKQNRPHTVILSSEMIFKGMCTEYAIQLKKRIYEITDDVTIVIYIRQPSKRYLSFVQQRIKSSSQFPFPSAIHIKKEIQACENLFSNKVKVIKFDRKSLFNNDISSDFFERFIPNASQLLSTCSPTIKNESLGAESMQILQTYQKVVHPDADDSLTTDTTLLPRVLKKIEKKNGLYNRPVLLADIAKYIDQSSEDFVWLKDKYGIFFDDIDYNLVQEDKQNPYKNITQIAEICDINEEHLSQLTMHALQATLSERQILLPNKITMFLRRNSGHPFIQLIRPLTLIKKIRKYIFV